MKSDQITALAVQPCALAAERRLLPTAVSSVLQRFVYVVLTAEEQGAFHLFMMWSVSNHHTACCCLGAKRFLHALDSSSAPPSHRRTPPTPPPLI